MIKSAFGIIVLAIILSASAVQAATLVNRDTASHSIVIVEEDNRKELVVEAGQELTDICQGICNLYIGNDPEPYDIASTDNLEIHDGQLLYQSDTTEGTVQE